MHHLFSPFRIGVLELKNRIVMPSLASFLLEGAGSIPERAVEHYRLRAAGGCGMVFMEACAVSADGVVSPNQARIDSDLQIEGLARIAAAIRSEGAVPAVQLHHAGRQTSAKVIGCLPVAPSPLPCPTIRGEVRTLSIPDIQELIEKFAAAADRAVQAGFELIEIHGAHGYLVNQFLSPFSNIRDDDYGGDTARRTRFAAEIVREVRRRLGPAFPLSFKISAQEFVDGGLDVPQSIAILKILVGAGIDVVQVSAGNDATPEWIAQPMFMPPACLADSAAAVKRALTIPVMAVGRINDPLIADDLIARSVADLVCMGRGLVADPELPRKAQSGRLDEIRKCIGCNTCMQSIFRLGRVECLVNPTLGREKEMEIRPAAVCKKIMVIGGGPGGLNFSWVAAQRGHEVHLYEKTDSLGGQLLLGSVTDYKHEMLSLVRFQETQVKRFGVNCHLNCEATPQTVADLRPDLVVLAAGSRPIRPPIDGVDLPHVVLSTEALNGLGSSAVRTIIIGGGPTGCEIALHLAEAGSMVTIVEVLRSIGKGLESTTRKVLLQRLRERGVQAFPAHQVLKIDKDGVLVRGMDGQERFIPAERVVVAVGNRPEDSMAAQIEALGYQVHRIGDCLEPGSAKSAIHHSAVLARQV